MVPGKYVVTNGVAGVRGFSDMVIGDLGDFGVAAAELPGWEFLLRTLFRYSSSFCWNAVVEATGSWAGVFVSVISVVSAPISWT